MNVALPPAAILDLCAGFGMLGEAVCLGLERLGLRGRVVCHVERDSAAAAALVARMEGSPLDQAPVWDDLATFDGEPWRGCVDICCAGLPCQPYSPAGKRRGNSDHRSHGDDGDGPVPHFLRIVAECRPAVVFLENVPAWVVGGHFRTVGDELCRLGYTIEDPVFVAADDVGAPHQRERVFILAVADAEHLPWRQLIARWRSDRGTAVVRAGAGVANGMRHGLSRSEKQHGGQIECGSHCPSGGHAQRCDEELAIAGGARREGIKRGGASGDEGEAARRSVAKCGGELGDAGISAGQRDSGSIRGAEGEGDRERLGDGDDAERSAIANPELGDAKYIAAGCGATGPGDGAPSGARRPQGARIRGSELGDSQRRRGQARNEDADGVDRADARTAAGAELRCGELPLFPPGRGDIDNPDHPDWWAWAAIAALDAALMPRVEPELSVVADGLAFSRADLLRIGGNGVVTVAAAIAFADRLAHVFKRIIGRE